MRSISCFVFGKPALVVGYCQGRKGKVLAVVVTCGALRQVKLKHVVLDNVPDGLCAARPLSPKAPNAESSHEYH